MFEIINQTAEEIKELRVVEELLKRVVEKEQLQQAIFNVIIVDNAYIHTLNKQYRGIDRPTDVISFALEDTPSIEMEVRMLGDIYISIEKARQQAVEYGHSLLREVSFLSVHGLLHLLGYDHMTKEDEKTMFGRQEEILNEAGITE